MDILLSDSVNAREENTTKDKQGNFRMIKKCKFHREARTILSTNRLNTRAHNHTKKNLTKFHERNKDGLDYTRCFNSTPCPIKTNGS